MTLTLVTGALGSGKTLVATYLGYLRWREGREVYSNYYTAMSSEVLPLEVLLMRKFDNCVILGDEGWTVIDSRQSTSGENEMLNRVILTSRKRGVDIILTAQMAHMVDKRYRGISDYQVLCERIGNERDRRAKIKAYVCFWDTTQDLMRGVKPYRIKVGKYCDLYDTTEEIENDKRLWLAEMARIVREDRELMRDLQQGKNITARRNLLQFYVGSRRSYTDALLMELGMG